MIDVLSIRRGLTLAAGLMIALSAPLAAQETSVAFGTATDRSAPIQVDSETLTVDQDSGTAVFTGKVLVEQDSMRLSADRVEVIYNEDQTDITRLLATGSVTLVSGEDAAESEQADYDVATGELLMSGNVLLVRGPSTISAEKMRVDVEAGNAVMEGRVRTLLSQGGN